MDNVTIDEGELYEYSTVSDAYTVSLAAGEMTVARYYEWDISDDGTWEYVCPSSGPDGEEVTEVVYTDTNTGDLAIKCYYGDEMTEFDKEITSTAETIYRYETLGLPSAPVYTADSDDETIYSLSYSEDEATGLKDRFGVGDIESSFSEIGNFFSSSAETLYNTMNISRFNFKKTNAPAMANANLSAIGTFAVGSSLTAVESVDSSTDDGGY